MKLSSEIKVMLLIVLLGLVAAVLLCSGCKSGAESGTGQLSGTAVDGHADPDGQSVDMDICRGGVPAGKVQHSTESGRLGAVSGGNGYGINSYVTDFGRLSQSDCVSVRGRGDTVCAYDFVYLGRSDDLKTGQRDREVHLMVAAFGCGVIIGAIAGVLIWRNNQRKMSDWIDGLFDLVDVNDDGKVNKDDAEAIVLAIKSKFGIKTTEPQRATEVAEARNETAALRVPPKGGSE